MAGVVEIGNQEGASSTVELAGLLRLLNDVGPSLVWSIQEFEAVANDDFTGDVTKIEQQAQESPNGLVLKWAALVALAESLFDVWNILIVGAKNVDSIPELTPLSTDFGSSEIVIERFDSAFWHVYARDDEIIKRFEKFRTG